MDTHSHTHIHTHTHTRTHSHTHAAVTAVREFFGYGFYFGTYEMINKHLLTHVPIAIRNSTKKRLLKRAGCVCMCAYVRVRIYVCIGFYAVCMCSYISLCIYISYDDNAFLFFLSLCLTICMCTPISYSTDHLNDNR